MAGLEALQLLGPVLTQQRGFLARDVELGLVH